ncbi:hypothetical protein RB195_020384 [Necator americanus]
MDGKPIELVSEFSYCGCMLKNNGSHEKDAPQRCAKTTSAFKSLTKYPWSTPNTYEVKLRVYLSEIHAIIIHGTGGMGRLTVMEKPDCMKTKLLRQMFFFVQFMLISVTTKTAFATSKLPQLSQYNSIFEQKKLKKAASYGNVVTVHVVGETRCPDTTRFIENHLLPAFKKFRGRLQIKYHPYGPTKHTFCSRSKAGVVCKCQHGPRECDKNALQACVIDALPNAEDHLDIVACIQGPRSFNYVFYKCITNLVSSRQVRDRISQCADSDEGKLLMARHGARSLGIGAAITWVPWIAINGVRNPAAEEHFEDVLCNQYFDPRPPECPRIKA